MASILAGLGTSLATGFLKNTAKTFAKDKNLLVPLDDVKNSQVISDKNLKKQICGRDGSAPIKKAPRRNKKKTPIKKRQTKRKKTRLSKLERLLERLED